MSHTVASPSGGAHRVFPEMGRSVMAKAELARLRKAEIDEIRSGIGRCVTRARQIVGWNLEELTQRCGTDLEPRDPRQVQRWCEGRERPQFDVLLAISESDFGNVLLVELLRFRGARITQRIELPDRRLSA